MAKRGSPDFPPVVAGARLGEWATGAYAAVGLLLARWGVLKGGAAQLLDVSALEACAMTFSMYPVTFRSIMGRPLTSARSLNFPGIEKTRNDWVGFMTSTKDQWHAFCRLVEQLDWVDDPRLDQVNDRLYMRSQLAPGISKWMSERTTEEILELAAAARVPAAPIGRNHPDVRTFQGPLDIRYKSSWGLYTAACPVSLLWRHYSETFRYRPATRAAHRRNNRHRQPDDATTAGQESLDGTSTSRYSDPRFHGILGRTNGRPPPGSLRRRCHPRRINPSTRLDSLQHMPHC